jgi:hypothetical protein
MGKRNERKGERYVKSLVYTFAFPIIGFPGWLEAIPEDLRKDMPMIRMIQLLKEPDTFLELASDEEAMIYISTASFATPLDHHWTRIYMHLTRNYMLKRKRQKPEDLPDFLREETRLDDYERKLLKDLKRWIRRKQLEHMKSIEKKERLSIQQPIAVHKDLSLTDWL